MRNFGFRGNRWVDTVSPDRYIGPMKSRFPTLYVFIILIVCSFFPGCHQEENFGVKHRAISSYDYSFRLKPVQKILSHTKDAPQIYTRNLVPANGANEVWCLHQRIKIENQTWHNGFTIKIRALDPPLSLLPGLDEEHKGVYLKFWYFYDNPIVISDSEWHTLELPFNKFFNSGYCVSNPLTSFPDMSNKDLFFFLIPQGERNTEICFDAGPLRTFQNKPRHPFKRGIL